ncbi:MAG TPA: lysyl oxidase family protein [Solirubrobacterales bacterium]|nr:lysyl oxidase family protein [Solirubrobacterales bacterium]
MRTRIFLASLALAAVLAPGVGSAAEIENPCEGPEAHKLLCPNLRIGRPSELYLDRTSDGRALLRATSDVQSRGLGPMELRGRRNGSRTMKTNQRIYRKGGGHITVPSEATLRFTYVGTYFGGSYWKVHQLAHFDLIRVRPDGSLGDVVRTSPKLNYCLRDLYRTRAGRRSPPSRHYPGCNQNPFRDRVALGTSVGWSDIYPAAYHQQWIDVSGLRGCFAYRMTVDPTEVLFESNESDNSSQILVRLPYRGRTGC